MKNQVSRKVVNELNGVIMSRNLYVNGRRAIDAHIVDGKLAVRDLHTEQSVILTPSDKLTDGYGSEVAI